ncbi:hypothetical protein DM867_09895 [Halosegnis rubeus]|jgi:rubrerythrin|uniref:Ribbon-helix-helix protein, CopG family n=1 Tax=Halosegnis rubeus TaxID=2212850 RepID=A0A5N5UFM5_9EURY|nr:hypothetical protein [Halosegnis rubeus]KAB7513287.1 hypothetical protein DM867_09895 [Halosegnis rubeus]KAB7517270.1 hypothetical protein DP108_09640 [Halosegnis rubeus]
MATESESSRLSIRLPPDLESWLEELADERGMDRDRLLERLLEANQRALKQGDGGELSVRIDELESEFDEKIDDIRSRVLQLKRQTEAKAPADHEHDEFDQFDTLEDQLTQITQTVSTLEADIEELANAVETHDEALETTQQRLRRVAAAVVRLQQQAGRDDDDRLTKLRDIAAQRGFETATCRACGNSVNISLLSEAVCPHCSTEFGDITGSNGFFSTPKLVAGSSDQ